MTAGESRVDAMRLLDLFDELVELGTAARALRISALGAEDPALAARLQGMLDADDAEGLLDDDLLAAAPTVFGRLHESATVQGERPDRAGQQFGPFVLERLLGRGGMGEVWLARRVEADFRLEVAVKLLELGGEATERFRFFMREQRILAALEHPGIARFIDAGIQAGQPWFAMERVDGVPIIEFARARSLGIRARVRLLADVVEAVAYAQTRLVIHRDLKPANILVDEDGRVRVLDFGIAKVLDEDAGEHTRTGLRALSPAYAAPEQILGQPVGTATDVFALGVVLHELLTGVLPHDRSRMRLDALADALRSHSVRPPSERIRSPEARATAGLPSRASRELDADLDLVVLTALRFEPDRRYASAAAMLQDLHRWLDGRPIHARPESGSYRLRKFVRRHRFAVAAGLSFLLALMLGLGAALWQAKLAGEAAARADAQALRATTVKNFFVQMILQGSASQQRDGAETTAKDWVEAAADRVDEALQDAPEAQADVRAALAGSLLALGDHQRARALLEAALPELRAKAEREPEELVAALQYLARAQRADRDLDLARATLDEALARNALQPDRALRLETALQLRTQMLTQANAEARHEEALRLGLALLADREALYGADGTALAVDWHNLGQTYNVLDRPEEARRALHSALRLLRSDADSPVSRQAFVYAGLCLASLGTGALDDAIAQANEAYTIATRTLSDTHDIVQIAQTCRANALRYRGLYPEARAVLDEVIERGDSIKPELLATAQLAWALTRLAEGAHDEALPRLLEAEQSFARTPLRNKGTMYAAELGVLLARALAGSCEGAVERSDRVLDALDAAEVGQGQRRAELELLASGVMRACGRESLADSLRRRAEKRWRSSWGNAGTPLPGLLEGAVSY